jgi:nucleoside-diphosphate-sugar epimerase
MKTLITGATGFIGSRLALRCLDEGMAVRGLGRRRSPVEEENARELEGRGAQIREVSVEDRGELAAAMAGVEVVFHLAAAQHEANVPDEYFRAVNVDGTRNVFDAAEAEGVGRVVHGSTIGVYGWRPGQIVGEGAPLEPDNIYGVTKLEGEGVVRSYAGRVPFAIARISETYGPGDRRLLKLFKGVERGLCLQIGAGRNLHHLVYIDDLVAGLLGAARKEQALGRTFVLAGREPVTTRAMLEAVSRSLGRPPRIVRVPLAPLELTAALLEGTLRPLGVQPPLHRRRLDFFRKSFAFSLEEALALGYKPEVGLDGGMRATARWYVDQGLVSPGG